MTMRESLLAGAGQRGITPAVGCNLFGYRPDIVSESVNDALTVTAIALSQGGTAAMLISATLGAFQTELADEIRALAAAETRIPHVLLSATHTHSGPNTAGLQGWGGIAREYCDNILVPGILAAAKEAAASRRPALLGIGTAQSKVGINRRQHSLDGRIGLGQNPWGCFDPTMTVLRFAEPNGSAIANIIHYGAHCTGSGCNTEITRDWPGVMLDRLEAESGAPAMFLNGAFGDVGPRLSNGKTTGNLRYALELGGIAASDAVQAWRNAKNAKPANLSVITGELELPLKPRLPREEAQKLFDETSSNSINVHSQKRQYYRNVLAAWDSGLQEEAHLAFPQTLVSLGDVVFVPFPFELFSEISLRLREYSPFAHTLCMGITNGYEAYLPSQDQLCRGGYEVDMFRTSRTQPLADNTDDHIIRENLWMMEGLK